MVTSPTGSEAATSKSDVLKPRCVLTSYFLKLIFRCAIEGLVNDTYKVQDINHEALINASIPPSDNGEHKYDQCHRFEVTQDGHMSKVKCSKWVYDDSIFKSSLGAEVI